MNRNDMVIDTVSDQDVVLGAIRRGDVFKARANFRVVHVLVFDSSGRLLVQKIPDRPDARHPGFWGSSVAGYVSAGESYGEAAERKVRDELGIASGSLDAVGRTSMMDAGVRKFIGVFTARIDGQIAPNPEDFAAYDFVPVPALLSGAVAPLTPTFEHVLDFYRGKAATFLQTP